MCGICGAAGAIRFDLASAVSDMTATMQHRGPDDGGVWCAPDSRVGFGHRRLAVIDLSAKSHQPMVDGSVSLVFNGEIYNFRELRAELQAAGHTFRSSGDAEVLIKAYRSWGRRVLDRLNGMYAFALYDAEVGELLLARDRAGEKPLFYSQVNGSFLFASELKAIMRWPEFEPILDVDALQYYLAYGFVPGAHCLLQGVHKLPPGHALACNVRTNAVEVWPYWQLPEPQAGTHRAQLIDDLEALLLDAVRMRLVADVPLGVMLSGGIDSGLVTALAARSSTTTLRTFTVTFPEYPEFDESKAAALVARHFGTEHIELQAEAVSIDLLPQLARQCDEPIADSSMIPTYLVSRLIRRHATVALAGDGGDELFGGYPHYMWVQRAQAWRRVVPESVRRALANFGANRLPVGVRGRNHLIGFAGDERLGLAHINLYFDSSTRARLLRPLRASGARQSVVPEAYKASLYGSGSLLQKATRIDFLSYLPDALLVKVDRASMLTALEVRAPFLDHRVIEFAFRDVPDELRATAWTRKVLLKSLAARLLPKGLDLQRKRGFSIPIDRWMAGPWLRSFKELLASAEDLFDGAVVNDLFAGQLRGRNNGQRLFALGMLELWRREYNVKLPELEPLALQVLG